MPDQTLPVESRPPVPPCARVRWNDWPSIQVPALGSWVPDRAISVVIPHHQEPPSLEATLRGLCAQTYPRSLLEVVVAGVQSPPAMPAWAEDLSIEVVLSEGDRLGPAGARNLGVDRASGEILVFLDQGMIPERQYLQAHARWHHVVRDAVTLGFQRHADLRGLDGEAIFEALRSGTVPQLVADRAPGSPAWVEEAMRRTSELTSPQAALWQVVEGGNLGIRRELFTEVGRFDESAALWGAGDGEFGFRALQNGAILVPERSALCWHQFPNGEPGQAADRPPIEHRARMRHLIADPAFRTISPGRSFAVPMVVIDLQVRDADNREDVLGAVDSILAGVFHDLVIRVLVPAGHREAAWIAEEFGADPRVQVNPDAEGASTRASPVRITTTPSARFGAHTIRAVLERLGEQAVGALHITVPWDEPYHHVIEVRLTRAERRAQRIASNETEAAHTIGALFGERWETGLNFDIDPNRLDVPLVLLTPQLRARGRVGPGATPGGLRKGGKKGRRRPLSAGGGLGTEQAAPRRHNRRRVTPPDAGGQWNQKAVAAIVDGWLASEESLAAARSRRAVQTADAWSDLKRAGNPRSLVLAIRRLARAWFRRPRRVTPPEREQIERRVRRLLSG